MVTNILSSLILNSEKRNTMEEISHPFHTIVMSLHGFVLLNMLCRTMTSSGGRNFCIAPFNVRSVGGKSPSRQPGYR